MVRLRKDVPRLPEPQVQNLLAQLGIAQPKSRNAISRFLARG